MADEEIIIRLTQIIGSQREALDALWFIVIPPDADDYRRYENADEVASALLDHVKRLEERAQKAENQECQCWLCKFNRKKRRMYAVPASV